MRKLIVLTFAAVVLALAPSAQASSATPTRSTHRLQSKRLLVAHHPARNSKSRKQLRHKKGAATHKGKQSRKAGQA